MRKRLRVAAGAALGLFFLALALRGVDRSAVVGAVASASAGWLVLCVVALGSGYALRIARWRELLRPFRPDLPIAACAGPLLVGFALNNLLPLRGGDLARAFAFRERLGVPGPEVLGSLVAERLLDLASLLAALGLGLLALGPEIAPAGAAWAVVLAGAALLLGLAVAVVIPRRVWDRLRGGSGLLGAAGRVAGALEVLGSVKRFAILAALSFGAWAFEAAVFLAAGRALGLSLPMAAGPAILGAATLATLLPGTPGHVGTFDYFAQAAVAALGVPQERAVAYAFLVHLALWVPITLAGIVVLAATGIGFREAVGRGRSAGMP